MDDKLYDAEVTIRFRVVFYSKKETAKKNATGLADIIARNINEGSRSLHGVIILGNYIVDEVRGVNERIIPIE